jgi:flagella basal body P-ring formation protein FlgA
VLALAGLAVLVASARAQVAADQAAAIAAAQVAVVAAFGGDADVAIDRPVLSMAAGAPAATFAVVEPGSRTGGPVRFVLYVREGAANRRVGRLGAEVRVRAPHVRVRTAVEARTTPAAAALDVVRDDVGRQLLAPLPVLAAATSATTRRTLVAGEVVTASLLATPDAVASGDEVITVARVGGLEVRGRAIAFQSGSAGDTVIVVNPDSRKRLRGRVIGPALVEVLHGS